MPPALLTPAWAAARPKDRSTGQSTAVDRLQWLDALRGIAVMAVVIAHLSYLVFLELRPNLFVPWFDSGKYGVLVFFLVSGYIVPASLERHGSVRRFWISRLFRLYPLFALVMVVRVLIAAIGLVPLDLEIREDPVTAVVGHATFLQDLLGVENALNVLWTLSYEMVFYLLVTALFVFGFHRRTAEISVGFAAGSLLVAPFLPTIMLSQSAGSTRWVVAIATGILVLGLALAVSMRGAGRRMAGAVLIGGLALGLLVFNQRAGMWEGLIILATMFTGTTIFQVEHGRVSRRKGLAAIGSVWVLAILSGVVNFRLWAEAAGAELRNADRSWVIAIVLTGLTFGIAWLLRRRRFPRPLVWLGLVSYSIYLLHAILLSAFFRLLEDYRFGFTFVTQVGIAAGIFTILFVAAGLTHRYVERPAQLFGRGLSRAAAPRPPATSIAVADADQPDSPRSAGPRDAAEGPVNGTVPGPAPEQKPMAGSRKRDGRTRGHAGT
jgi:peptidoglycan/LPS O-acetylase OafA/YrhL